HPNRAASRRGKPVELQGVVVSAAAPSTPVGGAGRWVLPSSEPLAGGQPQLIEQQPLTGPRHEGVGDRDGLAPLTVPEEQAQGVQWLDVRKGLPSRSWSRGRATYTRGALPT